MSSIVYSVYIFENRDVVYPAHPVCQRQQNTRALLPPAVTLMRARYTACIVEVNAFMHTHTHTHAAPSQFHSQPHHAGYDAALRWLVGLVGIIICALCFLLLQKPFLP